jgi:hypothetical protein
MVRKGSTVLVRQRALQKRRKTALLVSSVRWVWGAFMQPSGSERGLKASEMDAFAGKTVGGRRSRTAGRAPFGRPRSRSDGATTRAVHGPPPTGGGTETSARACSACPTTELQPEPLGHDHCAGARRATNAERGLNADGDGNRGRCLAIVGTVHDRRSARSRHVDGVRRLWHRVGDPRRHAGVVRSHRRRRRHGRRRPAGSEGVEAQVLTALQYE